MGAIATFPLLVPPFFLPLFTASLGMSSGTGAGVVAAFNFSSALGRLICGLCSDQVGPLNTLFISLLLSALSMLIIWPISTSLGPLIVFVIVNGMANGGFFSTMPTVVGNTFGSARVSVVMGMVVTGWAGGYLLVSLRASGISAIMYSYVDLSLLIMCLGCTDRRIHPERGRRREPWDHQLSSGYFLCWRNDCCCCSNWAVYPAEDRQASAQEALVLDVSGGIFGK